MFFLDVGSEWKPKRRKSGQNGYVDSKLGCLGWSWLQLGLSWKMLESQLAGLAAQQAALVAQVAGLAAPEGDASRGDEWGWVSLRKKL